MQSQTLDIAVVIPCFNAEQYLAQTLGSVIDQSQPPRKIVVVDDGSTDKSLAIAQKFEAAYGELIQVHSECSGSAARSRNIGAAMAGDCDALMFLDADDVLAPDVLDVLAGALAAGPKRIAACPWRRLELLDGVWTSQPASCALRGTDQDPLGAWLTGWYYPPCSVLWSREAFVEIGGWDEAATVNDDGDLMMRALANGIALHETTAGTSYYRRLPEGQTSLSGKQHTYAGLVGRMTAISKIARILEEQGRIGIYREPISRAYGLIAADAAGRFAALCQQARVNKRHYAPNLWSRALTKRGHPNGAGTRPVAAAPRDRAEEIRFGLDRAREVEKTPFAKPGPRTSRANRPSIDVPTVSVVIPVYNRAYLLRRTIDSVLRQTFTDFEVLVVDDCSKDDPKLVVESFGDPRVRYLRQPENGGVAAARNRGLREARAPFIAFLDDDDEWFPEKLALQVDLFRRSPMDVGLIYTGVETVSDEGTRTYQMPSARGDLYRELLVKNILHGAPASGMIRRNVIRTAGFFDEDFPAIEDWDYWLRICRRYKVDCISKPLVRYNDFRTSSKVRESETRRSLNIKANLDARERLYRKHGAEMRKEGVAHLFLADSVRRHLAPEWRDVRGARRLAARAASLAPTSWIVRDVLRQAFISTNTRSVLRKSRRAVGSTARAAKRKIKAAVGLRELKP